MDICFFWNLNAFFFSTAIVLTKLLGIPISGPTLPVAKHYWWRSTFLTNGYPIVFLWRRFSIIFKKISVENIIRPEILLKNREGIVSDHTFSKIIVASKSSKRTTKQHWDIFRKNIRSKKALNVSQIEDLKLNRKDKYKCKRYREGKTYTSRIRLKTRVWSISE